jgi:nucleoid DNA-binding protein
MRSRTWAKKKTTPKKAVTKAATTPLTVNKAMLIKRMQTAADKAGMYSNGEELRKFINLYNQVITDALVAGEKVQIIEFGSFRVTDRLQEKDAIPEQGNQSKLKQPRTLSSRQP